MADDITISIDGVEIKTKPGKMVLEAAIEAGLYIPYLCYHSGMKPFAACRMCVVSVEGGRGYPAACTLPVQDGMKVRSEAEDINETRRSVMQMLIADHPNGCLTCHRVDICGPSDVCLRHVSVNDRCITCPKNERCEFKDTVRYLGMDMESPLDYKYKDIPLEVSDPFYDRDMNLCITCGRCVRVCDEIRGDAAIGFIERSGKALVGTSFGTSLLESGCEFCGACIDVCPVGALVEKNHKWEKPRKIEQSVCPHCPVGCQLNLEINSDGKFIRSVPDINGPSNKGQACFKGKFGLEFINSGGRIETPLIRRDGLLVKATWDEATDVVAGKLREFKGDSFSLLTSPTSTNEELYVSQKFARVVMNTNNIDQTNNVTPELTVGVERALGYGAATNSIWELEKSECILVFNSNVTENQNVVAVPIKKAVRQGSKLIVIDTRQVELTRQSDIWLRPSPGSELLLLGGILKILVESGLTAPEWIAEHCEDPDTLYYALHSLDLDVVQRISQVSLDKINEAAHLFGGSLTSSIVYGLDNLSPDIHRGCVLSLVNMALITSNVGKPNTGIFPMRNGANEQGAWDMGCVPYRLPGGRHWMDDAAKGQLENAWGCSLPSTRGLQVNEIMNADNLAGIRAMYLVGDSPNFTNGKFTVGYHTLENLEFLVVQDSFMSPATAIADVVLPRPLFNSKDGTYTNLERRIQTIRSSGQVQREGGRSEGSVLSDIAIKMGHGGFYRSSASDIMDEIASVCPIYAGVSYEKLAEQVFTVFRSGMDSPKPTQLLYSSKEYRGIQWPMSESVDGGTPVMYEGGFGNRKADLITPEFDTVLDTTNEEDGYTAWLVPGRVLLQSDRDSNLKKGRVNRIVRDELAQIHPELAKTAEVSQGEHVIVETARGNVSAVVQLDDSVPIGAISITTLFGQLALELQESDEIDPMSKVVGLDIIPAKLIKA
ncbi:MAG: molybdopterin-dependent oxidoreductase [Chloroflexota bacterium]|nr:molybdopterin-dependent oxidoreductase [Chloroflexota bacterium]